nr:diguanylate cyclase [Rhizobium leguminosarum]
MEVAGNHGAVHRFGGEEFAIVMLGTDQKEAKSLAERLRGGIERAPITYLGRPLGTGFDRRCVNTRRATVDKPDAEAGVPSSSEGWWAQRRHHRLGYRRCRAGRRLGCYVR